MDDLISNVKVAVRVRPSLEDKKIQNKREDHKRVVVTCGEKTLSVTHPSENGTKRFTVRNTSCTIVAPSHLAHKMYSLIFRMMKTRHNKRFIMIWQNPLWIKHLWDTTVRFSRTDRRDRERRTRC